MSSIEPQRAMITGRVWQAIAQSGVDTSGIPRDQMERMVGSITDGMLLTIDEILGTMDAHVPSYDADTTSPQVSEGEQVLWEGRPFLSIGETYVITNERVRIMKGVFSKNVEDIELVRIQDIDYKQNMGERMVNVGDITIHGANASDPQLVLRNVASPSEVHEILRRAMLDARKAYRVRFQEEM